MSRLEIIYQTTANTVQLIHRLGNNELIPKELLHYLDIEDYNQVIYYCKGEDVSPRLDKVLHEASLMKNIMPEDSWQEFKEYQLLIRVLSEQSRVDDIPVLGYLRSRQFFWLKIDTYNFKKLMKHNRHKRVECAQNLAIV